MTNNPAAASVPASSRRQFLKTSSAATAGIIAGPAILGTKSSAASPGDTIKVGLIGAGGRGTGGAGNALTADGNAILTAVGDIYADQAARSISNLQASKAFGDRTRVEEKNVFVGF